jgi:hypothetical protein
MMGFPANPRATTPSLVLYLPRRSAGFHRVTDDSLLVIPRRWFHNHVRSNRRSSRMAQTPETLARLGPVDLIDAPN